ncbi:aminoglycoside phosphotransferase family protein [Mycolicibacterium sp.]|uniref:aminoglycoside phosphotransferase family protein n=1 Tax=Mycolicibacterium sp. TaxID=2320850 RepID=UPI001A2B0CAC|nr:aminoglycoside phosphotransferase family protein [Mycolicibacterium sp.]MBJ7338081.1 aminoglycoside resistance protein [Mycolicibacterium sp.]
MVTELSAALRAQLEQWDLRADGTATHRPSSSVLPVVTSDGTPAFLKVESPDSDSEHEHLVLRRWNGDGAVRLLRADPHRHALLVERLRSDDVSELWDVEACEIVAGLYQRLHIPALPQLRSLTSILERWTDEFDALPRSAPIPRRLVEHATTVSRELTAEPMSSAVVVHGDLHYGKVLASDRAPWLAVGPKPVNGDPHFEIAPMLWHRWDELAGNIRDGVRTRFLTLVDAADLDEARARAWTLVRVIHQATRVLGDGSHSGDRALTKYVALAKTVQE